MFRAVRTAPSIIRYSRCLYTPVKEKFNFNDGYDVEKFKTNINIYSHEEITKIDEMLQYEKKKNKYNSYGLILVATAGPCAAAYAILSGNFYDICSMLNQKGELANLALLFIGAISIISSPLNFARFRLIKRLDNVKKIDQMLEISYNKIFKDMEL